MAGLSDTKVRGAKGTGKPYKLSDGQQLYLHVSASGWRSWRMNYQFGRNAHGKPAQKTLTIGPYPAISLKAAREARDVAKEMLAHGLEPKPQDLFSRGKPAEDTRPTFERAAREWFDLQTRRWSKVHAADVLASLEADVFPAIGGRAIADVTAPDVFSLLKVVADRGAIERAHRLRQRISAIFVYGIALSMVTVDPAQNLALAIPPKPRSRPQPALTELPKLRQLLVDCEAERCRAPTKFALRLLALTAVRPNEIHGARWEEFEDLDGPEPLWRIPAWRMKGDLDRKADPDGDHLVPLAPQAVAIVKATAAINGEFPLLFPTDRNFTKPMSENTLRALLIRAGYFQRHVPHGFRAAFSTIMNGRCERAWRAAGHHGLSPDRAIIDLMLAHVPTNKVESAYNRAAYMERRRELACEWADLLTADMWPPEMHLGRPMRWAATGPGRPRG